MRPDVGMMLEPRRSGPCRSALGRGFGARGRQSRAPRPRSTRGRSPFQEVAEVLHHELIARIGDLFCASLHAVSWRTEIGHLGFELARSCWMGGGNRMTSNRNLDARARGGVAPSLSSRP